MSTILVVEDDIGIADFLHLALEDEGYSVDITYNGSEALAHLKHHPADVVLSDIMMPHVDGITLCRTINKDPRYHTIPVILMSAVVQPLNLADCDYKAFVRKPLDLDALIETVQSVIKQGPS